MTPLPDIADLRRHLQAGGVIAYATESCFGLGCDPRNRAAVKTILRLKGRPQSKGLILVGSDFTQFRRYLAPVEAKVVNQFKDYWPGPYTLLLPTSRRCPKWLSGQHAKLAVRLTAHAEAARLCRQLGMALVSTSANRSGQQALKTAEACQREFGDAVWVLPGRVGKRRRPSTIVDPITKKVFRS